MEEGKSALILHKSFSRGYEFPFCYFSLHLANLWYGPKAEGGGKGEDLPGK